ncbi:MAG: hypothetical protein ACI945_001488 [Pseudohongiellaceae bacterium]|jgi:hypothetical protein
MEAQEKLLRPVPRKQIAKMLMLILIAVLGTYITTQQ